MAEQKKPIRRLRAILFIGVGLVLAWQVLSRSFVAYLAEVAPQSALGISPQDPTALLNLAEKTLHPGSGSGREAAPAVDLTTKGGGVEGEGVEGEQERLRVWADVAYKAAHRGLSRDADAGSGPSSPPISPHLDSETIARVRTWVGSALASDPLNARGLRLLGQLTELAGEPYHQVTKIMRATVARSIHERMAVYWLMENSFKEGDYATALYCADALLRTRPQLLQRVMPTLAKMTQYEHASAELKTLLEKNPPWRNQFLGALPRWVSDARTPLEFLLALRETPHPPVAADLRDYLSVLVQNKLYELAYYTWLQFLPPEQLETVSAPFNGGFETSPSGLPFDWMIKPGAGVVIDILDRPDAEKQRALAVEFGLGRVEFGDVSQLLVLSPGTYQFKASYKAQMVGRRGLVWRITCHDGSGVPLGQSPMITGSNAAWQDLNFTFVVPNSGCPAQELRLLLDARSASERLVSGSSWHDEIRIVRG